MSQVWFRYIDYQVSAGVDEWEEPLGPSSTHIRVIECPIMSTTPKGVWLLDRYGNRRLVLHNSRKKYACETLKEAQESFAARKARQARIYSARVRQAENALSQINRLMGQTKKELF